MVSPVGGAGLLGGGLGGGGLEGERGSVHTSSPCLKPNGGHVDGLAVGDFHREVGCVETCFALLCFASLATDGQWGSRMFDVGKAWAHRSYHLINVDR